MTFARRQRRRPRPDLPGDEFARLAALPKPQFKAERDEQMDTSGLPQRKIHPDRDANYRKWLRFQDCAIKGKRDHVCWSRARLKGRTLSEAAHAGKSYSGALKRNDSDCMPLCELAHSEQERNHDAFDLKYGINRLEIAAEHYARFLAEQERF